MPWCFITAIVAQTKTDIMSNLEREVQDRIRKGRTKVGILFQVRQDILRVRGGEYNVISL